MEWFPQLSEYFSPKATGNCFMLYSSFPSFFLFFFLSLPLPLPLPSSFPSFLPSSFPSFPSFLLPPLPPSFLFYPYFKDNFAHWLKVVHLLTFIHAPSHLPPALHLLEPKTGGRVFRGELMKTRNSVQERKWVE